MQAQSVAEFEWIFISKSRFGLYLLRLLLRSLFFYCWGKLQKIYILIIIIEAKYKS